MDHGDGFNTRAVHAGEIMDERFGNVVTPIFETATFMSPNRSADPYMDTSRGEPFLYTRWGNPTTQALECCCLEYWRDNISTTFVHYLPSMHCPCVETIPMIHGLVMPARS